MWNNLCLFTHTCSALSLFQTGSLRWNRIHVHLPLYLSRLCWPVAIKSSLKCHFIWASVVQKYQSRSMWFREVDGVNHDDVHRTTQTDCLSSQWKGFFFFFLHFILCDSLPESRQRVCQRLNSDCASSVWNAGCSNLCADVALWLKVTLFGLFTGKPGRVQKMC